MSSSPRRLHPAEVVFAIGDALRELLVPLVVGVLLGSGAGSGRGLLLAAAFAGVGVVMAMARWRATTYALTGDALTFRSGLFSPDETVVPRARIGSVDLVQGPVQRLLGVVELQVHVAGGGEDPEIRLRAIGREEARDLQAALGHPAPPPAPPAFRLSTGRLVVAALTGPQLGLLLPVVGAAGALVQPLLENGEGERLARRAADSPGSVALAAATVLALAAVLAIAGGVVAFAGFEVRVDGDRLRIRRGLLQRRAASLPLDRVHAVRLLESPLRQPFGLVSVRLETAGYRGQRAATRTLVPLASRREAERLLDGLVPVLGGEEDPAIALRRPPRRAARRYVLHSAAPGAVLAAVLVLVVPGAWPAAVVLVAGAAGLGLLRFRDAGWRLDGRRITVRERRLGRSTLVARRARLQRHATSASPLQRRAGLAAFELAVGSGAEGRVDQVDAADAARLFAELRPARVAPAPQSPPAGTRREAHDGRTQDDASRRTDEPEAESRRGAEPGPPRTDPGD